MRHSYPCFFGFFSDVSFDAPSVLPTSQSTQQAIFPRPSRRRIFFSNVLVNAELVQRILPKNFRRRRFSRRPKRSSDVSVDTPKTFSTSQSALRESLPLAGPAVREDYPLEALERSSVDQVSSAKRSSDVPVGGPKYFKCSSLWRRGHKNFRKNLLTSQLTHQKDCWRLGKWQGKSSDVPAGAGRNRSAADNSNIYQNFKSKIEDESFCMVFIGLINKKNPPST